MPERPFTASEQSNQLGWPNELFPKPMSIDLIITEGNDAGKTQPGVYELTAPDTLSIGLATPGNTTRPAAIAQAELQVVLKKTK